jgi:Ser/Thr protein kinase RdoA (MazF antagonist)
LRDRIEPVLERYGLRGSRSSLLKQDQHKMLFHVVSPTRDRFLLRTYKRHRRFAVSEDVLRSELLWLQSLRREMRLAVPEPVPAADGSLVCHVACEGNPEALRCVLLRWLPGRRKGADLSPSDLSLAGSYVARLHRHSERYAVPEGFVRPYVWNWDWVFGETAPLWDKGESVYSADELDVFRAAAGRVRRDLHTLGKGSDVFGVIHQDLHPDNFVFHEGEAYAIDFENCGWGYYLFDLAVTLWALEAYGDRRAPMQAAFLEGYRRERTLPDGYARYVEAFMAMRVARKVNRILDGKTPGLRPQGRRRLLAGSVRRLEGFVSSDERAGPEAFGPPR